jgi:hypothetical protein
MGFMIEQSDTRGHCGWLMPQYGAKATRRVGIRSHAEVFPTREQAMNAIERLRPGFNTVTFHFKVSSDDAS